jgi:virginiamycin B lyase
VRSATGIDAGSGSRLGVAPGLAAGALRLVAAGRLSGSFAVPTSVLAGEDVGLTGLVVARDAIIAGRRLVARGALAARDVALGTDARLAFETGFECATGADCDDGDPCTAETCLDAACVRGPAADGLACDDGDACTVDDACRAGACGPGAPVVTEHPAGLARPSRIVTGPDGALWFISPESAADVSDGALARLDPATGVVAVYPLGRQLTDLTVGSDGNLWMAARLGPASGVEGLRSLLRFSPAGVLVEELLGLPAERVAAGPDGNVWFASEVELAQIAAAIRPADGLVTAILFVGNRVRSMTGGPDGNVWMAESNGGLAPARVGRVTPAGVLDEFLVPTPGDLADITSGADGNLWLADPGRNAIVRMTPGGMATAFPIPTPASGPSGVVASPDGAVWFTEHDANRIGRLAPDGQVTEIDCIPSPSSGPMGIARTPDGRLWFTQSAAGKVGSLRSAR